MNYQFLFEILQTTHERLYQNAVRSVNIHLTMRNWLFGFYILEFEQNGVDRAKYGDKLLGRLANQLQIKGLTAPELSRCRQFYSVYPDIFGTVSQDLINSLFRRK